MKEINYYTKNKGLIALEKIIKGTIKKEDISVLIDQDLYSLYDYEGKKLTLLHIACISESLSIVKLFDINSFKKINRYETIRLSLFVNFLDFVRLNDLGEDIYEYLFSQGLEDSLFLIEETENTVYKKFTDEILRVKEEEEIKKKKLQEEEELKKKKLQEEEENYKKIVEDYEKFIFDNNSSETTKEIYFSNVEKIDFTKIKINDINKVIKNGHISLTILRLIFYFDDIERFKYLLSIGANINTSTINGSSLFNMKSCGNLCYKELIKHCLENNIPISDQKSQFINTIREIYQDISTDLEKLKTEKLENFVIVNQ